MAAFHPNAPFIDGQAVGNTPITRACHGKPGVGEAPSQGGITLAVVHVAVNPFTINFPNVYREKFCNIFIGRPVDGHAKLVTVTLHEPNPQFRALEPVVSEPVKVGELLIGQLVHLPIRPSNRFQPNEIFQ